MNLNWIGRYYGFNIKLDVKSGKFITDSPVKIEHTSFNEVKRQLKKLYKHKYKNVELVNRRGEVYKCGVARDDNGMPALFTENGDLVIGTGDFYYNTEEVRTALADIKKSEDILKENKFSIYKDIA